MEFQFTFYLLYLPGMSDAYAHAVDGLTRALLDALLAPPSARTAEHLFNVDAWLQHLSRAEPFLNCIVPRVFAR